MYCQEASDSRSSAERSGALGQEAIASFYMKIKACLAAIGYGDSCRRQIRSGRRWRLLTNSLGLLVIELNKRSLLSATTASLDPRTASS